MTRDHRSGFPPYPTVAFRTILCCAALLATLSPPAHAESSALIREASRMLAGRDFIESATIFGEVLASDDDNDVAREGLGHSLAGVAIEARRNLREDRSDEAIELLERAIELNPGGSEKLDTLKGQAEAQLAELAPPVQPESSEPEGSATAAVAVAGITTTGAAVAASDASKLPRPPADRSEFVPFPTIEATPPPAIPDEPDKPAAASDPEPTDDEQWQLADYPQEDFDALLTTGQQHLESGDRAQALDHFQVARSVRPDDAAAAEGYRATIAAIAAKMRALIDAGELDAAQALLNDAREAAPGDETLALAADLLRASRRR